MNWILFLAKVIQKENFFKSQYQMEFVFQYLEITKLFENFGFHI